ncbi:P-loop containing nucleoside triphosphate hydrolase protein [Apiospora saccharicola]|uniref:P-loop containing nucleoside triphosphate hydrolase protein n=1 Tax=Apiospora saccharicola TaxID=335842 RepID=A0ABR1W3D8_9PEZI
MAATKGFVLVSCKYDMRCNEAALQTHGVLPEAVAKIKTVKALTVERFLRRGGTCGCQDGSGVFDFLKSHSFVPFPNSSPANPANSSSKHPSDGPDGFGKNPPGSSGKHPSTSGKNLSTSAINIKRREDYANMDPASKDRVRTRVKRNRAVKMARDSLLSTAWDDVSQHTHTHVDVAWY